jgi:hypothetical protein
MMDSPVQRWGDHVRGIKDGKTEHIAFNSIGNVVATDEHVFLLTTPFRAVIVPKLAFKNQTTMLVFKSKVDQGPQDS